MTAQKILRSSAESLDHFPASPGYIAAAQVANLDNGEVSSAPLHIPPDPTSSTDAFKTPRKSRGCRSQDREQSEPRHSSRSIQPTPKATDSMRKASQHRAQQQQREDDEAALPPGNLSPQTDGADIDAGDPRPSSLIAVAATSSPHVASSSPVAPNALCDAMDQSRGPMQGIDGDLLASGPTMLQMAGTSSVRYPSIPQNGLPPIPMQSWDQFYASSPPLTLHTRIATSRPRDRLVCLQRSLAKRMQWLIFRVRHRRSASTPARCLCATSKMMKAPDRQHTWSISSRVFLLSTCLPRDCRSLGWS